MRRETSTPRDGWEKIIESQGLEAARRIMEQDDDFGFVRNHLTRELADELKMFRYNARADGQIKVLDMDLSALQESVLALQRPGVPLRISRLIGVGLDD